MFINEVTMLPRMVDGRRFVEHTINSKFERGNVSITTIKMNDKPILKNYVFDGPDAIRTFWKDLTSPCKEVTDFIVEKGKGLNITI